MLESPHALELLTRPLCPFPRSLFLSLDIPPATDRLLAFGLLHIEVGERGKGTGERRILQWENLFSRLVGSSRPRAGGGSVKMCCILYVLVFTLPSLLSFLLTHTAHSTLEKHNTQYTHSTHTKTYTPRRGIFLSSLHLSLSISPHLSAFFLNHFSGRKDVLLSFCLSDSVSLLFFYMIPWQVDSLLYYLFSLSLSLSLLSQHVSSTPYT